MTLRVEGLGIEIAGAPVVESVSFEIRDGERFGIIGESGSGKSLTALAVLGLLPPGARVSGSIRWDDRELVGMPERALARLRGDALSIVFQDPRTALNPVRTVGRQIAEPLRIHAGLSRRAARERAIEAAARVQLPQPERIVDRYPHELSGGQRQRVAIATALVCRPRLLIADEPTTALDVTIQAEILALLRALADEEGMALAFITHDLAVLSQVATRAIVMAHGHLVEEADTTVLLRHPSSPVTQALLRDAAATGWRGSAEGAR